MAQQTLEYKDRVLEIFQDEYAESPRNFDNLGVMVCCHPRYDLGDVQTDASLEEHLMSEDMDIGDIAVMLPLYLYDHSGISMSCGERTYPYDDPWDSSAVGVIYVTKKRAREEWGVQRLSRKTLRQIEATLAAEVETYDQYLQGDVYGFVLYEKSMCNHGKEHLTETDSCCGFFYIESNTISC